jgi:hypothetical protein
MLGPHIRTLTQNDKVNAFTKKLKLWRINTEHSILDMFATFESCPRSERVVNTNISSTTLVLFKNRLHCILNALMSQNVNGLETH